MTAIMAIVEDENGDVIMLQLYQQEDESARAAADIVNVSTILLVKEPTSRSWEMASMVYVWIISLMSSNLTATMLGSLQRGSRS